MTVILNFGICDDQPYACKDIEARIRKYMEGTKLEYKTHIFLSGVELLKFKNKIDILFLDIEMPKIDGFTAAEKMNQKNDELILIFITGYTERFQRAFRVNAFRYILKPISFREFNEALSDAISQVFSEQKILVDDDNRCVLISDSKILYVESIGDQSVVHTENAGKLVSKKTLKYWTSVLEPAKFIQTHKSFIVSFEYILSIQENILTITNGATIPVSTRNVRTVKSGLEGYIRRVTKRECICSKE